MFYYENYNSKLAKLNKLSLENLIKNKGTLKSTYYQMLHILDKKSINNKAITISIEDNDNESMGYIIYYIKDDSNNTAHIAQICVGNKFKRQGVGKSLIQAVLNKEKDVKFITADINFTNIISQKFFVSQGFNLIKVPDKERYLATKQYRK